MLTIICCTKVADYKIINYLSSSSLIDFVVFQLSKAGKPFDNNQACAKAIYEYAYHILSGILVEQSWELSKKQLGIGKSHLEFVDLVFYDQYCRLEITFLITF